MTRLPFTRTIKLLLTVLVMLAMSEGFVHAQTRSRIQGTVKDAKTGEPLPGVNVLVVGTTMGAVTDLDGRYFIVNVPVGTYDLRASMVGYSPVLVKDVLVSLDRVATVDFSLQSSEIQTNEVVVVAQRNQLHQEVSGTQMVSTGNEITSVAGIREINSFLSKLPGVSTDQNGFLEIRGGTADQVGTLINGLAYDNAAVGNSETSVPLSAIEQVSVLSGGYNAEYGNFRSGLINITTKTGTENAYHATIDVSTDLSHMRRFGQSLYDPTNAFLAPYLEPDVAFGGTNSGAWDQYQQTHHAQFQGWNYYASQYNTGKAISQQASPLELYLLTSWMTMTVPDYSALQKQIAANPTILGGMTAAQADSMMNATKGAFASHANHETGSDYNFDGGFGGPVPIVGKVLGDATFYLSNNTKSTNYIEPVTLNNDFKSTSLLTVKSTPSSNISLTLNGLWKREIGISPIRPASGDEPNVGDRGGFMQQNNLNYIFDNAGLSGDKIDYLYDQAYFPVLDQTTLMTGLTFNHMLSSKTYYQITLNRLAITDNSPTGDNRDTTMITQIGPFMLDQSPYNKLQFATSHHVNGFIFPSYDAPPGMSGFRFRGKEGNLFDRSKTYQYQAKVDFSSQIGDHNFVKTGFEFNDFILDHNFWEQWNNNAYNTYEFNYYRTPSQSAYYLQDQINYGDIVANLGVRFDYYFGGGGLWPSSDSAFLFSSAFQPISVGDTLFDILKSGQSFIWNQWEIYNQTHPGFLRKIDNFFTVSPRIGLSFPITDRSKFYFNYGQFRSDPPYYSMYEYTYRYTKNGLYQMSNPNMEPPLTVSYELGVEYNVFQGIMMRVSGYYKDISGQQGSVTYQSALSSFSYNYNGYLNNEYESIQGVEVNISKNDNSWINGWINFNYMLSKTGNTGFETIQDYTPPDPTQFLYNNESPTLPRPHLNADLTFKSPRNWGPQPAGLDILGDWSLTFFGEWQAGEYFSWNPLAQLHVQDNMQWPDFYNLDMKLTRTFQIGGISIAAYLNVTNILNLKIADWGSMYEFSSVLQGPAASDQAGWYPNNSDEALYLASLHLSMYSSPAYDNLRAQNPGLYVAGNDKVGDLRSGSKPYIQDPSYAGVFLYGQPRDIWFGVKVDF